MRDIYLPGERDRTRIQLRLLQIACALGWGVVAGAAGFHLGAAQVLGCGF